MTMTLDLVTERLTFWDYLRHGALLKSISRDLMKGGSAPGISGKKGELFELAVKRAVEKEVRGTSHVKHSVKVRDVGQQVWEIDVGFVFGDVLFLVEVKNYLKRVQYYFDGAEV